MLVSKNAKICVTPNANPKICVTPNANPQCKEVEYRSRWVPNAKFSRWPCRFHVVCASFFALAAQKLANVNADSRGIQALPYNRICRTSQCTQGKIFFFKLPYNSPNNNTNSPQASVTFRYQGVYRYFKMYLRPFLRLFKTYCKISIIS